MGPSYKLTICKSAPRKSRPFGKYLGINQTIFKLFLFSDSQNGYSFTYELCDQMQWKPNYRFQVVVQIQSKIIYLRVSNTYPG